VAAGGLADDAGQDVEIRRYVSEGSPGRTRPPEPRLAASGTELISFEAAPLPGPQIIHVNLATAAAESRGAYCLEDGDVVAVSKRVPKPIYVMGLVRKPGEYELPTSKDMYLLDALTKAGDRSIQAADKVFIIRHLPGRNKPVVIQASIREAKMLGQANLRLAPGDIVSVEETPATVVVDVLKNFMRFGFGLSSTVPLF
jgi:polysaccharide export outer membrane protein